MALSPRIQFHKIGFLEQRRNFFSFSSFFTKFSSSSTKTGKSDKSKKSAEAKEQRVSAVESFVKKYMQRHPGVFPKTTEVQNGVGVSYYLLKDIIKELKGRVLSGFKIQEQSSLEKLDVVEDTPASKTRNEVQTLDIDQLKSRVQPLEGETQPFLEKDTSSTLTHIAEDKSSGSNVISEDQADCVKLVESRDGSGYETNLNQVFAHKSEDRSSRSILESEDPPDSVKLVESGDVGEFETSKEITATAPLRKMSSAESGENSLKCNARTSQPPSNIPSPNYGAVKPVRLVDFFRKQEMEQSITHETPSDILNDSSSAVTTANGIKGLLNRVKELNAEPSRGGTLVENREYSFKIKAKASQSPNHMYTSNSRAVKPVQLVNFFTKHERKPSITHEMPSDVSKDSSRDVTLEDDLKGLMAQAEGLNAEPFGKRTLVENGEKSSRNKAKTSQTPNDINSSNSGTVESGQSVDIFVKQKMEPSIAHDTASDNSKDSSGDVTEKDVIKGLLDRVKGLNETSDINSLRHIRSESKNQVTNGGFVRNNSIESHLHGGLKKLDTQKQQKSVGETYRTGMLKSHILDKIHKTEPQDIHLSHVTQEKDNGTSTKKDDFVNQNVSNSLDVNEKSPADPTPFEAFVFESLSGSDQASRPDKEAPDCRKAELSIRTPDLNKGAPQERSTIPVLFTEKGRKDQTNLLVRFLPKSVNATEIRNAFKGYGPIAEIRFIQSKKESKFQDAYICFKNKEGFQIARDKTGVVVGDADVAVSFPDPSTSFANKIIAPELVGDPEVPITLLGNPTRTIALKSLPPDIALHQLRETFSFCGREISGFYVDPSSSVAYLEFETEDAKEKALAKASVIVSGKEISLLRIDTPFTTVVRITNSTSETKESDVHMTCSLHGEVKRLTRRGHHTFDVQFKLAEWPNMVKILNSLNGLVVNNGKWIAQPATVIPVEILQALWSNQDGRRQVCSLMQNLYRKLGESPIDTPELNSLMDQYSTERT